MFKKIISLPNKTFYKIEEIATAIAKTTPKKPSDDTGIDCIKQKMIPPTRMQIDPKFTNKPFNLFLFNGFSETRDLTKEDRSHLKEILKKLPPVSHFMSNDEIGEFFNAYYNLPNRPAWEPKLTSPDARRKMQGTYNECINKHSLSILKYCEAEKLVLVDSQNTPISSEDFSFSKKALIPGKMAKKYLKSAGFQLIVHTHSDSNNNTLNSNESTINTLTTQSLTSKTLTSHQQSKEEKPRRTNEILIVINNYIKCSNISIHDNELLHKLWLHCVDLAERGIGPFEKHVNGLIHLKRNVNAKKDTFDKAALRQRLYRLRDKFEVSQP